MAALPPPRPTWTFAIQVGWTASSPPHGIARDFALLGANVFGLYLETRPSAPQCADPAETNAGGQPGGSRPGQADQGAALRLRAG